MTESGKERSISEAIAERRATPSFDGSSVPEDVLSAILNAGMEAPSGYNLQPWRFIVVRTPDQKKRLREAAMGQQKVEEAGAVIVCCGDLNAARGKNLENVLAEAGKHGFSQDRRQLGAPGPLFERAALGKSNSPAHCQCTPAAALATRRTEAQ